MRVRGLVASVSLLCILAVSCLANKRLTYEEGTIHYLRVPIYNTNAHTTTVENGTVRYLSSPICPDDLESLIGDDRYPEPTVFFPKGSRVFITSIDKKQGSSIKIQLKWNNAIGELFLRLDNKQTLQSAFDVVFSSDPLNEQLDALTYSNLMDYGKTEKDVLKLLGPPLSICEKKEGERYLFYNAWLLQKELGGFHDFFVETKDGEVVDVFGLY